MFRSSPLQPVIRFQVTTVGDHSSNMLQLVDDKKPTPGSIHSYLNSPCFSTMALHLYLTQGTVSNTQKYAHGENRTLKGQFLPIQSVCSESSPTASVSDGEVTLSGTDNTKLEEHNPFG